MKQDISENNLFYISFDTNKNIDIKELEGKDSNYNRARQPTNSLTIDDIIVNLKKKKLRFDDLKDINFVGSEPRIDGMNYTDEFKESLNTIKKRQLLKEIYIEEEKSFTPQMLHKELKEIYTTILNILITVVSSIVACWYWTPYMDINLRVLLCLFVGILVLVADVVVYNSFRRNTD
ncbi:hypothetical protein FOG51_02310 [Hanseniaspora uvarum]|nr:hypothetical protein FOG48_03926 [Hanseniaspora uvarum]KAF0272586.1 hypothetical protein FOG51_02310 [Hanseniaspora uvarum]KAF0278951.1 hypothetical protein FOG50_00156 [Hanseniaspora uvarum]